jgi:16S rRNA (guanine527-N7)-methyltransferase
MTNGQMYNWTEAGAEYGLEIPPPLAARLDGLATWLAERGLPLGLTNYPSPQRIAVRHMAPTLAMFRLPDFPRSGEALDLGAGGGALGLTLALLCPDLRVLLADRRRRSATFIGLTVARLGIENARAMQVEAAALGKEGPGQFDVVGFRALAAASEALRLSAPLLGPRGFVAAWHQAEDPAFLQPPPGWERTATVATSLPGLSVSQFRRSPPSGSD